MNTQVYQLNSPPLLTDAQKTSVHQSSHYSSLLQKLLRAEKHDLWITILYSVVIGLISLTIPIATQVIVNTVAFGTVLQPLIVLTIIVFFALGFSAALQVMRTWIVEILQQRVFVRIAGNITTKLLKSSIRTLRDHHGPELVNRFLEVATLQKAASVLLIDGLAVTSQIIFAAALLAVYHPWLLGFDLILLALISFFLLAFIRSGVTTSITESHTKYELVAWFEELARYPSLFRSSNSANYAVGRTERLLKLYLKHRQSHFSVLVKQIGGFLSIHALSSAALLGIGGWLVIQRQLTLGQLIAAELVVNLMLSSLSKFGKQLETYYDLQAAMDKLRHLTDLPLESEGRSFITSSREGMAVTLREVAVYRTKNDDVLHGINTTISSGERVALQGPAGSGKSALLDCICGLQPPNGGSIEVDGQDLRYIHLQSFRSEVALVREATIFDATVEENLTLGNPAISQADLRRTLVDLGVWEFISQLPEGLHTRLHAGDFKLSRSRAMQLTIARAIISSPRLLVLDGCVDHLTLTSGMLKVIFSKNRAWTIILCTADPVLQQRCDYVLTLFNGTVKREVLA